MTKNINRVLPKGVTTDVVTQESGDELLIYNLKTDRAVCLNKSAAVIWNLADGTRSKSDITTAAARILGSRIDEDFVEYTFELLKTDKLIETGETEELPSSNRRAMLKKLALTTTAALPVVLAITAPTAAHAASGCSSNTQCPSGCCFNKACTPVNAGGAPQGGSCNIDADCQSNCCDNGVCSPACGVCYI